MWTLPGIAVVVGLVAFVAIGLWLFGTDGDR